MATKHKYPTLKQLEDGVVIVCSGSGDPDLEEMATRKVRIQLVEDELGEDDDDDDDDEEDWEDDENEDDDDEEWEEDDDDEDIETVRPLEDDEVTLDIAAFALAPRRRRWYNAGSYGTGLDMPWRAMDVLLLSDYLDRLVEHIGLDDEIECLS